MAYITVELLGEFAKKFADKCITIFAKKTDIPTSLPASGGNAETVNNHTVNEDVPEGAKFTDTVYTHPASSGSRHIPSGGSEGQILRWSADGTAAWGEDSNSTYGDMTGASDSKGGSAGLAPAPEAGQQNCFLRGDGTWAEIQDATIADIDAIIAETFAE